MRQTILILMIILFNLKSFGQTSTIGYIPETKEIVLCVDNINTTSASYSPYGLYTIYSPNRVLNGTYLDYFPRTLGVNFAIRKNMVNIGFGVSADFLPFNEYKFYPDILVRLHPVKFFTKDSRSPDVSIMLNVSKNPEVGFGISIPFTLNRM